MHRNKGNGAIAQLVEQRTENPCVPGSIPGGTTIKKPLTLLRGFLLTQFKNVELGLSLKFVLYYILVP